MLISNDLFLRKTGNGQRKTVKLNWDGGVIAIKLDGYDA